MSAPLCLGTCRSCDGLSANEKEEKMIKVHLRQDKPCYQMDRILSGGKRYSPFEQLTQVFPII